MFLVALSEYDQVLVESDNEVDSSRCLFIHLPVLLLSAEFLSAHIHCLVESYNVNAYRTATFRFFVQAVLFNRSYSRMGWAWTSKKRTVADNWNTVLQFEHNT